MVVHRINGFHTSIPEMTGGWGSSLMRNEEDFMVLDGMMIAVAVLAFTLFHPALFLPTLRTRV